MLGLAEDVYAAEIEGGLIILDLKRDDYTFLAPENAEIIIGLLERPTKAHVGTHSDDALQELMRAGLVTADAVARPAKKIVQAAFLQEVPRLLGRERPRITTAHILNFARSWVQAQFMLKCLPLRYVAARVKRRRAGLAEPVPERLEELVDVFRRLRPLVFKRGDRCLLNSLSLINFLACYGIDARWRFGVRLFPFQAHAWAQGETILYDDMPTLIHEYAVIFEA